MQSKVSSKNVLGQLESWHPEQFDKVLNLCGKIICDELKYKGIEVTVEASQKDLNNFIVLKIIVDENVSIVVKEQADMFEYCLQYKSLTLIKCLEKFLRFNELYNLK